MIINTLEKVFLEYCDRIAVIDDTGEYSYYNLEKATNQLATYLINQGYGRGQRIGIYLERSYLAIVSMIGIMKANATYVPISRNSPQARNDTIAKDCELAAVITDYEQEEKIFSTTNICITRVLKECAEVQQVSNVGKEDISYILYTSGSTGTPKGVCITYEAFSFFVDWIVREFHIKKEDRIVSISSFSFDLSVFEIYGSLSTGATVCITNSGIKSWPNIFCEFLAKQKISILYAVPSFLNGLAHYGSASNYDLSSLRLILFAGEVYWVKNFRLLYQEFPKQIEYANLYGPTETNVCTYYRVPIPYESESEFPIGKLLPGLSYSIEKTNDNDDGSGELVVFGPCVMKNYWGEQAGHHEKHWSVMNGQIGYRTGDIVNLIQDGNLFLLGRKDNIIKVNGYRVSLEEINRTILESSLVDEVYVGAVTRANMQEIVAFVKLLNVESQTNLSEVKKYCKSKLISYMVPARIIGCSDFPHTITNKIDGKRLLFNYQHKENIE